MLDMFQIAAGSVIGKDHISSGKCLIGRNNQDAYSVLRSNDFIVAFVNDGCGSGKHSEVGAWIAAKSLARGVMDGYTKSPSSLNPSFAMELARVNVLAQIRIMANTFGGSFSMVINDYFLFTTVGLLITPEITQVVAIGDGVYALNNCVYGNNTGLEDLGPFPGNMPPYMAYDLVDSDIDPQLIKFRVMASIPTSELGGALIGSDGVTDLDRVANESIPGTKRPGPETVGLISQFWQDDCYFDNPQALGRKLRRCNSEVKRVNRESGRIDTHHRLLPDDTTIVSVRRKSIFHKEQP